MSVSQAEESLLSDVKKQYCCVFSTVFGTCLESFGSGKCVGEPNDFTYAYIDTNDSKQCKPLSAIGCNKDDKEGEECVVSDSVAVHAKSCFEVKQQTVTNQAIRVDQE